MKTTEFEAVLARITALQHNLRNLVKFEIVTGIFGVLALAFFLIATLVLSPDGELSYPFKSFIENPYYLIVGLPIAVYIPIFTYLFKVFVPSMDAFKVEYQELTESEKNAFFNMLDESHQHVLTKYFDYKPESNPAKA